MSWKKQLFYKNDIIMLMFDTRENTNLKQFLDRKKRNTNLPRKFRNTQLNICYYKRYIFKNVLFSF